jgi:uncharacterized protein (TIGR03083 family)
MNVTAVPTRDIERTSRDRGLSVCAAELDAMLDALRMLSDADWAKPTDCTEWTVQDQLAHVVGQFEGLASLRVFFRRHRVGHRRYPDRTRLAAMTQQQVDDLGRHSPATLIDMLATVGPKALRAARRMPALIRRLDGTRFFPEDPLPDPRLGYLLDVIAARDTWMHRVDIAVATGRPLAHDPHEREIVAQVVRELGDAWAGPPVVLELTGAPGGRWTLGSGEPVATVRADTVDYLRTLAGRNDNPALDIDGDPGVATPITAARVVF